MSQVRLSQKTVEGLKFSPTSGPQATLAGRWDSALLEHESSDRSLKNFGHHSYKAFSKGKTQEILAADKAYSSFKSPQKESPEKERAGGQERLSQREQERLSEKRKEYEKKLAKRPPLVRVEKPCVSEKILDELVDKYQVQRKQDGNMRAHHTSPERNGRYPHAQAQHDLMDSPRSMSVPKEWSNTRIDSPTSKFPTGMSFFPVHRDSPYNPSPHSRTPSPRSNNEYPRTPRQRSRSPLINGRITDEIQRTMKTTSQSNPIPWQRVKELPRERTERKQKQIRNKPPCQMANRTPNQTPNKAPKHTANKSHTTTKSDETFVRNAGSVIIGTATTHIEEDLNVIMHDVEEADQVLKSLADDADATQDLAGFAEDPGLSPQTKKAISQDVAKLHPNSMRKLIQKLQEKIQEVSAREQKAMRTVRYATKILDTKVAKMKESVEKIASLEQQLVEHQQKNQVLQNKMDDQMSEINNLSNELLSAKLKLKKVHDTNVDYELERMSIANMEKDMARKIEERAMELAEQMSPRAHLKNVGVQTIKDVKPAPTQTNDVLVLNEDQASSFLERRESQIGIEMQAHLSQAKAKSLDKLKEEQAKIARIETDLQNVKRRAGVLREKNKQLEKKEATYQGEISSKNTQIAMLENVIRRSMGEKQIGPREVRVPATNAGSAKEFGTGLPDFTPLEQRRGSSSSATSMGSSPIKLTPGSLSQKRHSHQKGLSPVMNVEHHEAAQKVRASQGVSPHNAFYTGSTQLGFGRSANTRRGVRGPVNGKSPTSINGRRTAEGFTASKYVFPQSSRRASPNSRNHQHGVKDGELLKDPAKDYVRSMSEGKFIHIQAKKPDSPAPFADEGIESRRQTSITGRANPGANDSGNGVSHVNRNANYMNTNATKPSKSSRDGFLFYQRDENDPLQSDNETVPSFDQAFNGFKEKQVEWGSQEKRVERGLQIKQVVLGLQGADYYDVCQMEEGDGDVKEIDRDMVGEDNLDATRLIQDSSSKEATSSDERLTHLGKAGLSDVIKSKESVEDTVAHQEEGVRDVSPKSNYGDPSPKSAEGKRAQKIQGAEVEHPRNIRPGRKAKRVQAEDVRLSDEEFQDGRLPINASPLFYYPESRDEESEAQSPIVRNSTGRRVVARPNRNAQSTGAVQLTRASPKRRGIAKKNSASRANSSIDTPIVSAKRLDDLVAELEGERGRVHADRLSKSARGFHLSSRNTIGNSRSNRMPGSVSSQASTQRHPDQLGEQRGGEKTKSLPTSASKKSSLSTSHLGAEDLTRIAHELSSKEMTVSNMTMSNAELPLTSSRDSVFMSAATRQSSRRNGERYSKRRTELDQKLRRECGYAVEREKVSPGKSPSTAVGRTRELMAEIHAVRAQQESYKTYRRIRSHELKSGSCNATRSRDTNGAHRHQIAHAHQLPNARWAHHSFHGRTRPQGKDEYVSNGTFSSSSSPSSLRVNDMHRQLALQNVRSVEPEDLYNPQIVQGQVPMEILQQGTEQVPQQMMPTDMHQPQQVHVGMQHQQFPTEIQHQQYPMEVPQQPPQPQPHVAPCIIHAGSAVPAGRQQCFVEVPHQNNFGVPVRFFREVPQANSRNDRQDTKAATQSCKGSSGNIPRVTSTQNNDFGNPIENWFHLNVDEHRVQEGESQTNDTQTNAEPVNPTHQALEHALQSIQSAEDLKIFLGQPGVAEVMFSMFQQRAAQKNEKKDEIPSSLPAQQTAPQASGPQEPISQSTPTVNPIANIEIAGSIVQNARANAETAQQADENAEDSAESEVTANLPDRIIPPHDDHAAEEEPNPRIPQETHLIPSMHFSKESSDPQSDFTAAGQPVPAPDVYPSVDTSKTTDDGNKPTCVFSPREDVIGSNLAQPNNFSQPSLGRPAHRQWFNAVDLSEFIARNSGPDSLASRQRTDAVRRVGQNLDGSGPNGSITVESIPNEMDEMAPLDSFVASGAASLRFYPDNSNPAPLHGDEVSIGGVQHISAPMQHTFGPVHIPSIGTSVSNVVRSLSAPRLQKYQPGERLLEWLPPGVDGVFKETALQTHSKKTVNSRDGSVDALSEKDMKKAEIRQNMQEMARRDPSLKNLMKAPGYEGPHKQILSPRKLDEGWDSGVKAPILTPATVLPSPLVPEMDVPPTDLKNFVPEVAVGLDLLNLAHLEPPPTFGFRKPEDPRRSKSESVSRQLFGQNKEDSGAWTPSQEKRASQKGDSFADLLQRQQEDLEAQCDSSVLRPPILAMPYVSPHMLCEKAKPEIDRVINTDALQGGMRVNEKVRAVRIPRVPTNVEEALRKSSREGLHSQSKATSKDDHVNYVVVDSLDGIPDDAMVIPASTLQKIATNVDRSIEKIMINDDIVLSQEGIQEVLNVIDEKKAKAPPLPDIPTGKLNEQVNLRNWLAYKSAVKQMQTGDLSDFLKLWSRISGKTKSEAQYDDVSSSDEGPPAFHPDDNGSFNGADRESNLSTLIHEGVANIVNIVEPTRSPASRSPHSVEAQPGGKSLWDRFHDYLDTVVEADPLNQEPTEENPHPVTTFFNFDKLKDVLIASVAEEREAERRLDPDAHFNDILRMQNEKLQVHADLIGGDIGFSPKTTPLASGFINALTSKLGMQKSDAPQSGDDGSTVQKEVSFVGNCKSKNSFEGSSGSSFNPDLPIQSSPSKGSSSVTTKSNYMFYDTEGKNTAAEAKLSPGGAQFSRPPSGRHDPGQPGCGVSGSGRSLAQQKRSQAVLQPVSHPATVATAHPTAANITQRIPYFVNPEEALDAQQKQLLKEYSATLEVEIRERRGSALTSFACLYRDLLQQPFIDVQDSGSSKRRNASLDSISCLMEIYMRNRSLDSSLTPLQMMIQNVAMASSECQHMAAVVCKFVRMLVEDDPIWGMATENREFADRLSVLLVMVNNWDKLRVQGLRIREQQMEMYSKVHVSQPAAAQLHSRHLLSNADAVRPMINVPRFDRSSFQRQLSPPRMLSLSNSVPVLFKNQAEPKTNGFVVNLDPRRVNRIMKASETAIATVREENKLGQSPRSKLPNGNADSSTKGLLPSPQKAGTPQKGGGKNRSAAAENGDMLMKSSASNISIPEMPKMPDFREVLTPKRSLTPIRTPGSMAQNAPHAYWQNPALQLARRPWSAREARQLTPPPPIAYQQPTLGFKPVVGPRVQKTPSRNRQGTENSALKIHVAPNPFSKMKSEPALKASPAFVSPFKLGQMPQLGFPKKKKPEPIEPPLPFADEEEDDDEVVIKNSKAHAEEPTRSVNSGKAFLKRALTTKISPSKSMPLDRKLPASSVPLANSIGELTKSVGFKSKMMSPEKNPPERKLSGTDISPGKVLTSAKSTPLKDAKDVVSVKVSKSYGLRGFSLPASRKSAAIVAELQTREDDEGATATTTIVNAIDEAPVTVTKKASLETPRKAAQKQQFVKSAAEITILRDTNAAQLQKLESVERVLTMLISARMRPASMNAADEEALHSVLRDLHVNVMPDFQKNAAHNYMNGSSRQSNSNTGAGLFQHMGILKRILRILRVMKVTLEDKIEEEEKQLAAIKQEEQETGGITITSVSSRERPAQKAIVDVGSLGVLGSSKEKPAPTPSIRGRKEESALIGTVTCGKENRRRPTLQIRKTERETSSSEKEILDDREEKAFFEKHGLKADAHEDGESYVVHVHDEDRAMGALDDLHSFVQRHSAKIQDLGKAVSTDAVSSSASEFDAGSSGVYEDAANPVTSSTVGTVAATSSSAAGPPGKVAATSSAVKFFSSQSRVFAITRKERGADLKIPPGKKGAAAKALKAKPGKAESPRKSSSPKVGSPKLGDTKGSGLISGKSPAAKKSPGAKQTLSPNAKKSPAGKNSPTGKNPPAGRKSPPGKFAPKQVASPKPASPEVRLVTIDLISKSDVKSEPSLLNTVASGDVTGRDSREIVQNNTNVVALQSGNGANASHSSSCSVKNVDPASVSNDVVASIVNAPTKNSAASGGNSELSKSAMQFYDDSEDGDGFEDGDGVEIYQPDVGREMQLEVGIEVQPDTGAGEIDVGKIGVAVEEYYNHFDFVGGLPAISELDELTREQILIMQEDPSSNIIWTPKDV